MTRRYDSYAAYLARYWTVAYLRALAVACGAGRAYLACEEWRQRSRR
jgi:hypothetical protein